MKKLLKQVKNVKELVFLDLEGTQISHELICLGAFKAKINDNGTIKRIDKGFKIYVKPINKIGHFVESLTGITNEVLLENKAVDFTTAMKLFKDYVGKIFNNTRFVTFGAHDMRILSQSQFHCKDSEPLMLRQIARNNIDLSKTISEYIKDEHNNSMSLTNYCKIFNIEFEGVQHDALYDAKNLALLYNAVLKRTDIVEKEYFKTLIKTRSVPRPIQLMLKKLESDGSVNLKDINTYVRQEIVGRKDD